MTPLHSRRSGFGASTWALGLLAAGLFLAACSGGAIDSAAAVETAGANGSESTAAPGLPPLLPLMESAPFGTPYRGMRVVTLDRANGILEVREDVGADGQGSFGVAIEEVMQAPHGMSHGLAEVILNSRVPFNLRYRDVRINDLSVFQRNYDVVHVPGTFVVAGHSCLRLDFRRRVPHFDRAVHYELDVDPTTGLVLAWSEFNRAGQRMSSSVFESLDYNADLTGLDLIDRVVQFTPLDPHGDLMAQAGHQVRVPDLPPLGYQLENAEIIEHPLGGRWVKFVYTDGLERVTLLQQPGSTPGVPSPSRIVYFPYGPWTLGAGEIDGTNFLVAGRVSDADLSDLIQSSLD